MVQPITDFDPEAGQYTQQDPIGLEGSNLTLYGYVKDPNMYIDPFGLDQCKKVFKNKGYSPKAGERTIDGYVKNNVPADKGVSLHTKSPGFNTSPKNADGQFKRFGTESHGGLSPHVHQPTRNVNPKTGDIYGGQVVMEVLHRKGNRMLNNYMNT